MPESASSESKKPRKRASHACVTCRTRKVRCDVTVFGPPCANCQLDGLECEVLSSRRSRKNPRMPMPGVYNVHTQARHGIRSSRRPPVLLAALQEDSTPPTPTSLGIVLDPEPSRKEIHLDNDDEADDGVDAHDTGVMTGGLPEPSSPYVSYDHHTFLSVTNLLAIPPQDVRFLDRQGCLLVPTRHVLDVFVRQYFLYLHPVLPILDEGAFWDMYDRRPSALAKDRKTISLLVFQSMLFACCNFVPRPVLRRLGFQTKRSARATLYRRAKLLFDLGTESSSLDKSRAALLLASWSFSSYEVPRTPSTPWLAIAVQYARDADAHRYATYDSDCEPYSSRKRLWWGCIIRDRLLGLGMRRPLHIRPSDFDLASHPPLAPSDLEGEAERSNVYDVETKGRLAQVLGLLTELCLALTDVMNLAFPVQEVVAVTGRSEEARDGLHRWYRDAVHRFCEICPGSRVHDSVFLNVSLLRLYYYAARIALGHHEILSNNKATDDESFRASQVDLQDAVTATTSCLEGLVRARLVDRLPVTAASCTALPLLLLALDVETSPPTAKPTDSTHAVVVRRRLAVLREAMETYQLQYEGIEWIRNAISQVATRARREPVFDREAAESEGEGDKQFRVPPSHWDEPSMPPFRPGGYLFLAASIEVVFSKGQLPEEDDDGALYLGLDSMTDSTNERVVKQTDDDMFDLGGLIETPETGVMEKSQGIGEDIWPADDEQTDAMGHALDWLSMFAAWEDVARS